SLPATLLGLALLAFPVAFSVPNLASALPALFPTEHRYSAMGIAYNVAVAIFGGTAPFIIAALIELSGEDMAIAYYLMAVAAVAAVAIRFLPESAGRHLPGSMPSVDSEEAARKLVETQDNNPLLDLDILPFEESFEIARAEHKGRPRNPTVM
ncbi:MAG: transporter, partial [Pseudarthrobacter sp.]|nr:transporter [Pseudarthrobacter sp.]